MRSNTSAPAYVPVTNLAVLNVPGSSDVVATNIGHVFLPQTPESFGYDPDGNLTNDGRWAYVWDAENRLISMQAISTVPDAAKRKLDFQYDYRGRRIRKVVSSWSSSGSAYVPQSTNCFVYDGWNLIGVLDGSGNLLQTFTCGLDLSGTMQGAGGVGGLLWTTTYGPQGTVLLASGDASGNVTTLVDGYSGAIAGEYEYGAFGEVIRATGPMAKLNPFTFQTEYYDWETDKYYWKNRYYDPSPGRWLSRDPLDEPGSLQLRPRHSRKRHYPGPLYVFVNNDGVNYIDWLGLDVYLDTHPVVRGENHSFVLLEVDCKSVWDDTPLFKFHSLPNGHHYATLGAGPGFGFWGHLINGVDRPKDADLSTVNYSRKIVDPPGMSDDDFITKLVNTHEHYNEKAWYALFPQADDDDYNSNGYVSGLLNIALGFDEGDIPQQPPNTPGFEKPVPHSYFP